MKNVILVTEQDAEPEVGITAGLYRYNPLTLEHDKLPPLNLLEDAGYSANVNSAGVNTAYVSKRVNGKNVRVYVGEIAEVLRDNGNLRIAYVGQGRILVSVSW